MKKIRYAVVGLGHIAQVAVLPAFSHATRNSELVSLISDDAAKRRKLAKKYGVAATFDYDDFEAGLAGVDAVYICLPNTQHAEYAIRAARAAVHVLCEKPMATTVGECERMIKAADKAGVKLMTAYRLHFEEANLRTAEVARSGKIGVPRFFSATFSMQVEEGNIRLKRELGGGPVWDIGIYCINAARMAFQAEPIEVAAFSATSDDPRFNEVPEMMSVMLRFPQDRLAQLTCSFGAADTSRYTVVGTEGEVSLDPAFEYAGELKMRVTKKGKSREVTFAPRDQFAPEIEYFSDCILSDTLPEPSGLEGLADVRIIDAILRSAKLGRPVLLPPAVLKTKMPNMSQEMKKPKVREPKVIHAQQPTQSN